MNNAVRGPFYNAKNAGRLRFWALSPVAISETESRAHRRSQITSQFLISFGVSFFCCGCVAQKCVACARCPRVCVPCVAAVCSLAPPGARGARTRPPRESPRPRTPDTRTVGRRATVRKSSCAACATHTHPTQLDSLPSPAGCDRRCSPTPKL